MMVTHEFWRDRDTGAYWAVELTDGDVTACAGPLRIDDMNARFLRELDYTADEAGRIQATRERFEPVREAELLLLDGD
jgi:hypothetical protein